MDTNHIELSGVTKKKTASHHSVYFIGNKRFVVTPVYRENGKKLYEALLNLMTKDSENH